jgi:ABC-type uncharacterized transport system permease subunit
MLPQCQTSIPFLSPFVLQAIAALALGLGKALIAALLKSRARSSEV